MSLLEVRGLGKTFGRNRGRHTAAPAVEGVDLDLEPGRCLGLVGESGAGKSTVGRLVLRLIEPDTGSVRFDGVDVRSVGGRRLRELRQNMQIIFQDPHGSLNPRQTIADALAEPLIVQRGMRKREAVHESSALLERVGLPLRVLRSFPRELSGGQLQRIAIARALTLRPKLIVCDEPVTALDASVRAQVINLMLDLQAEFSLAYLFISHDLALVETIADDVVIMRSGRIVESGPTERIFNDPEQPYTRELLAAAPRMVRQPAA